jgi:hypothetical protein
MRTPAGILMIIGGLGAMIGASLALGSCLSSGSFNRSHRVTECAGIGSDDYVIRRSLLHIQRETVQTSSSRCSLFRYRNPVHTWSAGHHVSGSERI